MPTKPWARPLNLTLIPTGDSLSFKAFSISETGLPIGQHPGAYGVQRKNHVHEGVDLYCAEGEPVYAVEAGAVVAVMPFTGPKAGMPWWRDTDVVLIEGLTGVVAYGEIASTVKVGQMVSAGEHIANVTQVLDVDKGRPMSMLHLELHITGARHCPEWTSCRPHASLDPTKFLMEAS